MTNALYAAAPDLLPFDQVILHEDAVLSEREQPGRGRRALSGREQQVHDGPVVGAPAGQHAPPLRVHRETVHRHHQVVVLPNQTG